MTPGQGRGGRIAAAIALLALSCGKSAERAAAPAARPTAAPAIAAVETFDVPSRNRRPAGGRAPVIWLGMDGLDWELLDRLVAEGRMPNWKRLAENGYTARLKSFLPILSPIVWTTLATGVGPDVHRVLDFQEVDPATGQKVPISGRTRAVPAIWNVASAAGRSVGVVGWWGTHPAEEVRGFFVSDHASPILFEGLPRAGVAYPASLAPGIEQILARDGRVSDEELARFIDVAPEEIARARGKGLEDPIGALSRILGATRAEARIARELYDRHLPDLMMLYFEGTDVIGHVFAPDVPPRMSCVPEAEFVRYHRAVDEYYARVDGILGQWMRRADEDGATLIVNSDHGFKWGDDRSCEKGSLNPATAAFWHRIDGVFVAYGARVRKSAERAGASVFDVAPTVAALLDIPIDRRSGGELVRAAFPDLRGPARKDLSATPVRRVAAEELSPEQANEYAKKLLALGYLSGAEPGKLAPTGGDRPGMTEGAWNNLGLYLVERPTPDLAAADAAFRKSLALRPDYASPQFNLAVLTRRRGDDAKAIDLLFRSFEAGHADPEGTILRWAAEYEGKGKARPAREVLERGAARYPASEPVGRRFGLLLYQGKDCEGAERAVARFEPASTSPETLNELALFRTCLGRPAEAIALFQRSLALKANQPGVVQSLNLLQKGLSAGQ